MFLSSFFSWFSGGFGGLRVAYAFQFGFLISVWIFLLFCLFVNSYYIMRSLEFVWSRKFVKLQGCFLGDTISLRGNLYICIIVCWLVLCYCGVSNLWIKGIELKGCFPSGFFDIIERCLVCFNLVRSCNVWC